jgi:hypothetical protein
MLTCIKEINFPGANIKVSSKTSTSTASQHPDSLWLIGKMLKQHYSFLQHEPDCADQENLMIFTGSDICDSN